MNVRNPAILAWSITLLLPAVAADELVFTPEDIIEWEHHSFEGQTRYALSEREGEAAIHAVCNQNSASGLFLEKTIDLEQTPILEWRWWVDSVHQGIDETERSGDDYPARLYAVDRYRFQVWRTRALNYVWASEMAVGADWPNAWQQRAHMVALQSGEPEAEGHWRIERRNLREDFQRFHGRDVSEIDALAIMTDCDDARQSTAAWYGEIRLMAE